jgi:type II secretory pathway pseudopilin PulG
MTTAAERNTECAPAEKRSREAGYSLLELMIVCCIIGIIANITIPELYESLYRAKATRIIEDFNTVRIAVHQQYADHSFYPPEVNAGVEPPELSPYLDNRILWTHNDYQYDWELWMDSGGNPTQPSTGVLVGFSISTQDPKLADWLKKLYKGRIIDTIPDHTTFVIEPYGS